MFKLKDIFTPSEKEEIIKESVENKKDEKPNRMSELVKSYETKNEIIKESEQKEMSTEVVDKTRARFAKLSHHRLDEYNESNLSSSSPIGQTVNSIDGSPINNQAVASGSADMYKGANVYALTEEEALEVSIKRALKSGSPVNNLSFYDEVNWNLGTLGFSPKLPVDIKNCIVKCIDAKVSE